MGTVQSRQQLPNEKNFDRLDYGYCIAWKRKIDQLQLMEEYPLYIQTDQRLNKYQNIWPLRTKHPILVNVYYFSHSKNNNLCGEWAKGSVFTERIPLRLSQFWNIPLKQSISILKTSLQGFEIIFESFGLFLIKSTMIGFTENLKTKIWFHTDFSQPQPQNPNCSSLQQMMISIINSIQNVQQYSLGSYLKFSQFLAEKNFYYLSKDFKLLLKGLDEYIMKMKIVLPNILYDLYHYKKQPEGWEKFRMKSNYPKLLKSSKIQDSKISNNQGMMTMSKLNDLRQQKIVSQIFSESTFPLKTPIPDRHSSKVTNQRMSFKQNSQIATNKPFLLPKYQSPHKQDNLKFWRSTEKTHTAYLSPQPKRLNQPHRFHSPPPSNITALNTVSSQNFYKKENESQISTAYNHSRNGSSKLLQSVREKNSEVSTNTGRNDRLSNRSSFSLIEDLEIIDQRKGSNLEIYNFKKGNDINFSVFKPLH